MINLVNNINNKYIDYSKDIKIESIPIKPNSNANKNQIELEKLSNINKMNINFGASRRAIPEYKKHILNNYEGCMLGLAIGDAFGNPIANESLEKIREEHGARGLTHLILNKDKATITDDTRLSIFTADGLIKSSIRQKGDDKIANFRDIYDSYKNWYKVQSKGIEVDDKGWVAKIKGLHNKKDTSLVAVDVIETGIPGSIEFPVNKSKDTEGIMRTAPIGLRYYKNPELAFEVGARCASLTHGSSDAYLSAGVYAAIVANIIQGKDIYTAVDDAVMILKKYKNSENLVNLIDKAQELASTRIAPRAAIRKLGKGWNVNEITAIGIYSAIKSQDDFENAIIISANHDGNSKVTAGITGGILGAYLGSDKIPEEWKKSIELGNEISTISEDLYKEYSEIKDFETRYPVDYSKPKYLKF